MREATSPYRTIYVRCVVDTDSVTPNGGPVDRGALIVTTTSGSVDADTGAVTVLADEGDLIRFYATSGSNNFEAAVLLDDIAFGGDDRIVDDTALVALPGMAWTPASETPLTLSHDGGAQEFWFWQSKVAGDGTQACQAVLALYARDDRGRPRLAGLYPWDFPLTVTLTEPSPSVNEGVAS